MNDYINGYIERQPNGQYAGKISIEGVALGTIEGIYFKQDGDNYLWLKRRRILEYDADTQSYKEREAKPQWEAYLKKITVDDGVVYRGEFNFIHFRFSIIGLWDKILGTDSRHRLNLVVERLPMSQQTIINGINERKRNEQG